MKRLILVMVCLVKIDLKIKNLRILILFFIYFKDFYAFSCNNWIKKEFIPDDKSTVSMFGKLRDDLRLKLRILLESPITNETEVFMKKSQSFYKSCMNLSKSIIFRC